MQEEPIATILHAEPLVQEAGLIGERPAPSVQQEQAVDGVFAKEEHDLPTAIVGLQAGLVLTQYLVVDHLKSKKEAEAEDERLRRLPKPS